MQLTRILTLSNRVPVVHETVLVCDHGSVHEMDCDPLTFRPIALQFARFRLTARSLLGVLDLPMPSSLAVVVDPSATLVVLASEDLLLLPRPNHLYPRASSPVEVAVMVVATHPPDGEVIPEVPFLAFSPVSWAQEHWLMQMTTST